jgi:hypothetical protein
MGKSRLNMGEKEGRGRQVLRQTAHKISTVFGDGDGDGKTAQK